MGTEYSLAAHPTRELFELGKYWAPVLIDDEIYRAGPWSLVDFSVYARSRFESRKGSEESDTKWFESVLPRLHAFCERARWDVDVVDDCDDFLWILIDGGYRTVDSVYDEFDAIDVERGPPEDIRVLDRAILRGLLTIEEGAFLREIAETNIRLRTESTVAQLRAARERRDG